MKELDEYFKLQKIIHEYFGYKEDWKVIPIDDCREYYWRLWQTADDEEGKVGYADTKKDLNRQDGQYYEDEIYTQRFLPKYTYRGKDFTMVACDPHVDGNKFLRIFDNAREVID